VSPRALQSFAITSFLGIGVDGEAVSHPLRQTRHGIGVLVSDARNMHRPEGKLTNKDIGYTQQAAAGAGVGSNPWRFQAWMIQSDNTRKLVGVANSKWWDQGDLTGTWTERASGLSASAKWIGEQYRDYIYAANGSDNPKVFDGTNLEDWFITEGIAPTMADQGAGNLTANGVYQYVYFYRRSADDHWSPASPIGTHTVGGSNQIVRVTFPSKTTQGVDKVRIYRTTDAGSTFRFVAEVASSGTFYDDNTADTALSLEEAPTLTAISDLQFDKLMVIGDRIYIAGITEESIKRPTRVRWTYPGQPWRVDALAFSDEIDDEITAMVRGPGGGLLFTPNEAHTIRHIGGGAHVIDGQDLPGCHDRFTVVAFPSGVGWMDPHSAYVITQTGGFKDLGEPQDSVPLPGAQRTEDSGIESLLEQVDDLDEVWVTHHGNNNYLLLGLRFAPASTYPDTILAYDLARGGWWRIEYGGAYPVRTPLETTHKAVRDLLIGQEDGTTIKAFNGETKNGAALVPQFSAGPLDVREVDQKRFRYVDVFWDLTAAQTIQFTSEIDVGAWSNTDIDIQTPNEDLLDTTFILDTSTLGGVTRSASRFCVGRRGDFLSFTMKETGGLSEVAIPRVDIAWQETTNRKNA
jgi:hypothetical protein